MVFLLNGSTHSIIFLQWVATYLFCVACSIFHLSRKMDFTFVCFLFHSILLLSTLRTLLLFAVPWAMLTNDGPNTPLFRSIDNSFHCSGEPVLNGHVSASAASVQWQDDIVIGDLLTCYAYYWSSIWRPVEEGSIPWQSSLVYKCHSSKVHLIFWSGNTTVLY